MRSEGYCTWSVCLSARTTGYEVANEWHQPVVNNRKMDINVAIFLKRLRSRDKRKSQRVVDRASSRTTCYEAANEWHQRDVNNEKMDANLAIFLKRLRSSVKTSEKANVRSIAHPLRQAT